MDPENSLGLMETNLPTPKNARVYVNLPEGTTLFILASGMDPEAPSHSGLPFLTNQAIFHPMGETNYRGQFGGHKAVSPS